MPTWPLILLSILILKFVLRIHKVISKKERQKLTRTAMDWELFKAQTIHLNRSRTEEERMQIFENSAVLSWENYQRNLVVAARLNHRNGGFNQPQSLMQVAALKIQFQLYRKNYIDLLNHITQGEGIYPKIWDQRAHDLRSKVIEFRRLTEQDVLKWAHDHFHE